jgi:hypothetical protein
MNLLIPYVQLRQHVDPKLEEFTYGDGGRRASKLKSDLEKGDFVFFHTSISGKKYITAYYVVDRVMDTLAACQDTLIGTKYKNPHIVECLARKSPIHGKDDAIVFGDPITSHILGKPLLFDRKLAEKLSLNIRFDANRPETQVIGSATRAWRELTDKDVKILLKAIGAAQTCLRPQLLRSAEEVGETIEKDIEDHLANNPALIGKGLRLTERQLPIGEGRLDLLFEDQKGNLVVVEVKFNYIGRDALRQVQTYVHELRKQVEKKVTGVLVCSGVMSAYEEDLRKQRDVRILVYGWNLHVQAW